MPLPLLPILAGLAGTETIRGLFGAYGAKKASEEQTAAAREAQAKIEGYYKPYYDIGTSNMERLSDLVNKNAYTPNMGTWQTDPGYQFRLNEGYNAIGANSAAMGMRFSGATMKALQRYGQNTASEEYQKVYDRRSDELNKQYLRQLGLADIGVGAVGGMSNAIAETIGARGNAQAAGTMGQANAYGNMFGNLESYLMLSGLMGNSQSPKQVAENKFRSDYGKMAWEK